MTHQACPVKDKLMTRRVATLCRCLFAALLLIGLFPALTETAAYAGEGNVDCHFVPDPRGDGGSTHCTYPGKTECVERPSSNNPIEAALIPQGESGCNKVISAGRVSTDFALEIPYDHCIDDGNGGYTNMPCWGESSSASVGGNIGGVYIVTPVDKAYIGNPNNVCTFRAKIGNWAAVHCDFGLNYPDEPIVIEPQYYVNVFGAGRYGYMNWYTITVGPLGKPTASITEAESPDRVLHFDGSSSTATNPQATVTQWHWTADDGSSAFGVKWDHKFAVPGNHTVTLVVTDDKGRSSEPLSITVAQKNEPGIVVNSTGDKSARDPANGCNTGVTLPASASPECTLRGAIEAANARYSAGSTGCCSRGHGSGRLLSASGGVGGAWC